MAELTLQSKLFAPQVESLVSRFLGIAPERKRYTYVEMEECIYHPIVAAGLEVRIALTLGAMGPYTNENKAIELEVQSAISNIKGSWSAQLADCCKFLAYGHSYTEARYEPMGSKAMLAQLQTLNPSRTRYEGKNGAIETVIYNVWRGETSEIKIPYESGMHLVNQPYLALESRPDGIGMLERIVPYYELYNLLIAALTVACNRQATPLLVGKTDTGLTIPMLDAVGRPMRDPKTGEPVLVNQGASMRDSLAQAENGSVIVIDRLDEVMAIAQQASIEMILEAIDLVIALMLISFLFPRTVLWANRSGVGDSGLNEGHLNLAKMTIQRDVQKLGDGLIESIFRPMLRYNYGDLEDYGRFPVLEDEAANAAELLKSITDALASGQLPVDEEILGRMKALAIG